jgi:hypothetical protein
MSSESSEPKKSKRKVSEPELDSKKSKKAKLETSNLESESSASSVAETSSKPKKQKKEVIIAPVTAGESTVAESCRLCGQPGHKSFQCKDRASVKKQAEEKRARINAASTSTPTASVDLASAVNPNACRICGVEGHKSFECDKNPARKPKTVEVEVKEAKKPSGVECRICGQVALRLYLLLQLMVVNACIYTNTIIQLFHLKCCI